MAYIYSLADTWADGATTFKGISLNVTDTASAAGSLLMDLQVGGVSQFKVGKTGTLTTPGSLVASTDVYWGRFLQAVSTSSTITWGDLILTRDAANTLAQRNGVNAQAFNLYNTYTDASNYERGFMRFVSNILRIGTESAGTGVARQLTLSANAVDLLSLGGAEGASSGVIVATQNVSLLSGKHLRFSNGTDFSRGIAGSAVTGVRISNGSTGGGTLEMTEMTAPVAPSANNVRIYAEDDGAGKTRLMALFATGAAVQIAIEP